MSKPTIGAAKKKVRDLLESLPNDMSFAQIVDELALIVALEESMEDYRHERLLPHADVMKKVANRLRQPERK